MSRKSTFGTPASASASASAGLSGSGSARKSSTLTSGSASASRPAKSLTNLRKDINKTLFTKTSITTTTATTTTGAGSTGLGSGRKSATPKVGVSGTLRMGKGGGPDDGDAPNAADDDFPVHSVADSKADTMKVQDAGGDGGDGDAGAGGEDEFDATATAAASGASILPAAADLSLTADRRNNALTLTVASPAVNRSPKPVPTSGGGGTSGGAGGGGSMDADTRIRVLARSNDELKKQLVQIKRESKDNVRVQMIKRLRVQLLEQTELTNALRKRCNVSDTDFEDVYQKVLNTPERVRPPRPEVLQQQIATTKQENFKLRDQVTVLKQQIKIMTDANGGAAGIGPLHETETEADIESSAVESKSRAAAQRQTAAQSQAANVKLASRNKELLAKHESEVGELRHQLGVARSELSARDQLLVMHKDALESSRADSQKLAAHVDKWKRADARCVELNKIVEKLKVELVRSLREQEMLLANNKAAGGATVNVTSTPETEKLLADVTKVRTELTAATELAASQRSEIALLNKQLTTAMQMAADAKAAVVIAASNSAAAAPPAAAATPAAATPSSDDTKALTELRARFAEVSAELQKLKDQPPSQPVAAAPEPAPAPTPAAVIELVQARTRITDLETEIKRLKEQPPPPPAPVPAPAPAPVPAADPVEVATLRSRIEKLEAEEKAAKTLTTLAGAQFKAKEAQCNALIAQVAALKNALSVTTKAGSITPRTAEVIRTATAAAADHSACDAARKKLDSEITDLTATVKRLETAAAAAGDSKSTSGGGDASALRAQITQLEETVDDQKTKLELKEERIAKIEDEIDEARTEVRTEMKKTHDSAIAALNAKIKSLESGKPVAAAGSGDSAALQKRVDELTKQLAEQKSSAGGSGGGGGGGDTAELKSRITHLEEELEDHKTKLELKEERINKIDEEVEEHVADAVKPLNAKIKKLETDLAAAGKSKPAAGGDAAALTKRVAELEAQLKAASSGGGAPAAASGGDSDELKRRVRALEDQIADQKTQSEYQDERISKIPDELEDARTEIRTEMKRTHDLAVQSLNGKIKGLEMELEEATKKIEASEKAAAEGKADGKDQKKPAAGDAAASAALAARVKELESSLAAAEAKLKAVASGAPASSSSDSDEIRRLRAELADKKSESEYQDSRISKFPAELEDARTEATKEANDKSTLVINTLKTRIVRLENDLSLLGVKEATPDVMAAPPPKKPAAPASGAAAVSASVAAPPTPKSAPKASAAPEPVPDSKSAAGGGDAKKCENCEDQIATLICEDESNRLLCAECDSELHVSAKTRVHKRKPIAAATAAASPAPAPTPTKPAIAPPVDVMRPKSALASLSGLPPVSMGRRGMLPPSLAGGAGAKPTPTAVPPPAAATAKVVSEASPAPPSQSKPKSSVSASASASIIEEVEEDLELGGDHSDGGDA